MLVKQTGVNILCHFLHLFRVVLRKIPFLPKLNHFINFLKHELLNCISGYTYLSQKMTNGWFDWTILLFHLLSGNLIHPAHFFPAFDVLHDPGVMQIWNGEAMLQISFLHFSTTKVKQNNYFILTHVQYLLKHFTHKIHLLIQA